jgi:hypothetical protein
MQGGDGGVVLLVTSLAISSEVFRSGKYPPDASPLSFSLHGNDNRSNQLRSLHASPHPHVRLY